MFAQIHSTRCLRFRQWRRKSYAAFNSIGKHVTIGNIKNIVADTLLRKQKTVETEVQIIAATETYFDEWDDPLEDQQQLIALAVVPNYKKNDCGHHKVCPALLYSKWLKATFIVVFSHFYFTYNTK